MTTDIKARLDAIKAPASKVTIATPLAEIDRQLNLAKIVDFAGEVSAVVNEVSGMTEECVGTIRQFRVLPVFVWVGG